MSAGFDPRSRAGITLVEVIVATAVLVLVTVVIVSSIVTSRTVVSRSVGNEPNAALAERMVDTLGAALVGGVVDPAELEPIVGGTYTANGDFSADTGGSRQFFFAPVADTEGPIGFTVHVSVFNDMGDSVHLKGYARQGSVGP